MKEAVIGESQQEGEAGLALCTFPAPCSCVWSRGPRTPILTGADTGQPMSVTHAQVDLEARIVVPQVVEILPAPRNEMPSIENFFTTGTAVSYAALKFPRITTLIFIAVSLDLQSFFSLLSLSRFIINEHSSRFID